MNAFSIIAAAFPASAEAAARIVHRLDKETAAVSSSQNDARISVCAVASGSEEDLSRPVAGTPKSHADDRAPRSAGIRCSGKNDSRSAARSRGQNGVSRAAIRRRHQLLEWHCSGRTHQIRVHLHHLGHAIFGDSLYGKKGGAPRQMLHAWKLGFNHPATNERLFLKAPIPQDFRRLQESAFR